MKTLIIAATRAEIAPLYKHFKLAEANFVQTPAFDLLISGVGMTATAFALGQRLNLSYNLVVNLGIAGCFDRSIPLGSVLNIIADEFSELGAENGDGFLSIDELGFGRSRIPARVPADTPFVAALKEVRGITVNSVHGRADSIAEVTNRLSPVTESMEGAAVFYCCNELSLPCIQIRSVSNYVEERNSSNWDIGLAIRNLNTWAIDYLTNR
ncbi:MULTISPECIES: futalosine hydrolase [Pedobacter]|uniref:futalosine hydrolase n=1 Tax=Pedobacter TaxID=84567 RepID=UPI00210CCF34|nr:MULTISPECIES: futalosine hydrolase [unclassified Pedobacter]